MSARNHLSENKNSNNNIPLFTNVYRTVAVPTQNSKNHQNAGQNTGQKGGKKKRKSRTMRGKGPICAAALIAGTGAYFLSKTRRRRRKKRRRKTRRIK